MTVTTPPSAGRDSSHEICRGLIAPAGLTFAPLPPAVLQAARASMVMATIVGLRDLFI